MEYQVYTRRRSTGTRRSELERQVMEAVGRLQQLREGIVYSSVMALPAPTAPPRPGMPIMHELPRRVHGMHSRLETHQNSVNRAEHNKIQLTGQNTPKFS
jgi:hypothetical protein